MRSFSRKRHDGLILDDVRDLAFLSDHQEKLQGKYDVSVEFGSTAGGTCKYDRVLFAVPIAVTANFSTQNIDYLWNHDWLGTAANRELICFGSL
jgi:hypothetical protein